MRIAISISRVSVLTRDKNCYHETGINVCTVKLHVLSSAVLKCEYRKQRNRKCECKIQQFLEMGHVNLSSTWQVVKK